MTYRTRTLLRRTLPVAFWLLAIGGCIAIPLLGGIPVPANYWFGFLVVSLVLLAIVVVARIDRHASSAKENFQISALLGLASYWMPTILLLLIPFWVFIVWKNASSFRAVLANFVGLGLDAIYAVILIYFGVIDNVWRLFFSPSYLWGWIPVGSILLAWLSSTIVRRLLRER